MKILKYQKFVVLFSASIFVVLLLTLVSSVSSWTEFWWMLPISFFIALTVNTVGISGAALFVPFFIVVFPYLSSFQMEPTQSVHLALITESFGLSSSALAFANFGLIDYKLGLKTILGALPMVVAGAILSFVVADTILYLMISAVLAVAVFLMLHSHQEHIKAQTDNKQLHVIKHSDIEGNVYTYNRDGYKHRSLGYGIGGLFQGLAGFGIGELGIVTMLRTNIPIRISIGTNHMVVAITAASASIIHVLQSSQSGIAIPWNIAIMTVPGVVLGGQLAPHVAARLPVNVLKYAVAALFIVLSLALLLIGLGVL